MDHQADVMKKLTSIKLGTFIVTCACATLGMMLSLCFLVFHIYHRNNKVVRMSSPYLNLLTSCGAICLSIVCFLYGLDYIVDDHQRSLTYLCQLRVWMIVLAVSMIFGPVLTKTWRVHKIFKYGFAKKVVIRDRRLIAAVLVILAVDCVLLTLWQTIDPPRAYNVIYSQKVLHPSDPTRSRNQTYMISDCLCDKMEVWVGVVSLWKLTLLVTCLYLAWKIRTVTVPCLNDAAHTFAAVFVTVIMTFSASLVTVTLQNDPDAVYILTCIILSAGGMLVQIILFVPKVRYWWKTPSDSSPRISSVSIRDHGHALPEQLNTGSHDNLFTSGDGLMDIVDENKTLKESLLKKEELISTLKYHLDNATEKLCRLATDVEVKHDSGLDVDDVESSDKEDVYDVLRSPDLTCDRSRMYRVNDDEKPPPDEMPASRNKTDAAPSPQQHGRQEAPLKHAGSLPSVKSSHGSFVANFTDLRKSIAADLESATGINKDLENAFTNDVIRSCSETEWLYESGDSRELAGSIAQSYHLGESNETYSYIQTYLPRENNVIQIRRCRRMSGSSALSMQSSENMSVRSVDVDNISCNIARDSATPTSQQHAAILRYYSYNHRDSFHVTGDPLLRHSQRHSAKQWVPNPSSLQRTPSDVYTVPIKPRILARLHTPKDSFV